MFRRAASAIAIRSFAKRSTLPINQNNYIYKTTSFHNHSILFRHNTYLSLVHARCFSNELAADWPEGIKEYFREVRFDKPTPIQEKTLPIVTKNKDLVGIARTGSGKTLAFVVPAILKVLQAKESRSFKDAKICAPICLLLAPTRELANQIGEVVQGFRKLGVKSICLVGGGSRSFQIEQLMRGDQDIFIATPGRLMDLIESNLIDLSDIRYLVLDEADRMLDMGFEPQIRRIVSSIPKDRQTVMWSATWPDEIKSLAEEFMQDYELVAIDSGSLKANPNITQIIEMCKPMEKVRVLTDQLKNFKEEIDRPRTLIFVNTKRMADTLLLNLMRSRIKAISIHGDKTQRQRDDALRMFRNQMCNTLVATDVAARGLDISDITHVINFDFPNTIEDYVHRIGRTARAERKGTAVTLFTENNANMAGKLIKILRETGQFVPDELLELAKNTDVYFAPQRNRRRRDDFYSTGRSTHRDRYDNRQQYQHRSRPADEDFENDDDVDYPRPARRSNFRDRYEDNRSYGRREQHNLFRDD